MKIIDNINSYKIGTNFCAWVSTIARNIAINYYNKNKKVDVLDPDDVVFQTESKESKLNYYLSFLDGVEKDIVIYHIILNMTFKEIGSILNMPFQTVFYEYKKAIKKIKSEI